MATKNKKIKKLAICCNLPVARVNGFNDKF
jgi:hypothetical protein